MRYIAQLLILLVFSCKSPENDIVRRLSGETMGTTYHITYLDNQARNFQTSIDSLLRAFNDEVSTYIPGSVISRFNQSVEPFDVGLTIDAAQDLPIPAAGTHPMEHFAANYSASLYCYLITNGTFDPTVMPLVNYWGFGYSAKRAVEQVDSMVVDSLRRLVGMDRVLQWEGEKLLKTAPGVQLDFSAIAKGYGVDLLGVFLEKQGIADYLAEIGGEVRARGHNDRGERWTIGVNTPSPEAGLADIQVAVQLPDRSLATSGNYRNFYEVDGKKYAHTINPKTGYPELSNLLSATVFAPTCTEADALATACMVMGLEKAFTFIASQTHLDAYFIYSADDGPMQARYTPGLEPFIRK